MSLFSRHEKRNVVGMYDPVVGMFNARRSGGAGGPVSSDRADRHMAVWRCKHLLADMVSGLPVDQFRDTDAGRLRMSAAEFVREPSDLIDANEWMYSMMLSAVTCGNAFAYATRYDPAGRLLRAEVVPEQEMDVRQPNGFLSPAEYRIAGKPVDPDRVLHLRGFGPKPGTVMGMSPIQAMGPTVSLGLAVREFGSSWYASGGHPTTLLSTEQEIDDTTALAAKEKFRNATTGDHIAVMGNGWGLKSVQQDPSDALFLSATNATTIDICGYYGVPPEFLGYSASGSSLTYANREQRILDLLTTTVGWWVGRMERLISRHIPAGQFVRLDVDALLRSDALTRWTIHDKAVRMGAMSIDEVRVIEDEPALDGDTGNQFLWPPSGQGAGMSVTSDPQGATL